MKAVLTIEQVRALVLIAPKKDPRYYLNGALFDFDKRFAVATCGAALIALRPESMDGAGQVIVPREALDVVSKGGKIADTVTIEVLEQDKTYGGTDLGAGLAVTRDCLNGASVRTTAIDATYPPVSSVIPKTVSGEPGQYNPVLLARVDKALRLATSAGSFATFTVGYNGQSAALCVLPGRGDKAIGVVMPLNAKHVASVDAERLEFFEGTDE